MIEQISLNFPNIWIKNPEPSRITEQIVSLFPERTIFTTDYENGFSQYIDSTWKPILVPNPAAEESGVPYITTHNQDLAHEYIQKNKESFNLPIYIHSYTSDPRSLQYIAASLSNNVSSYRNAFWSDDISLLPVQNIYISPYDCPQELSFYFNIVEENLPTAQEIYTIITHIDEASHNRFITRDQYKEVINASLGLTESYIIDYCLTSIKVNNKISSDYIQSRKTSKIKSQGILEILSPKITFDNIGGLDNIKDVIRRTAKLRQNREAAEKYGVTPIRRLLMVGVPGTGKSAICQATAAELDLDLARTGISQVMNSYIGQSEANMRAVFQQIRAMNPLCVWIDEFGRDLSGSGSSHVDGGTTDRVHGEFLTGLQELPEESFLLCAANELHSLKPEMLRADRFDKIFFVGLPSFEERAHIFKINLSHIETDHSFNYDQLADATAFMTGAEIVSLIKETKFYVVSDSLRPITTDDILKVSPNIKNTIWRKHPDVVKSMYEYALENWDWASTSQSEDAKIILGKTSSVSKKKVTFS